MEIVMQCMTCLTEIVETSVEGSMTPDYACECGEPTVALGELPWADQSSGPCPGSDIACTRGPNGAPVITDGGPCEGCNARIDTLHDESRA
jgi:hypothetical protein